MSKQITQQLLEQYHLGLCSEAERKAVEAWLESPVIDQAFPDDVNLVSMEEAEWQSLAGKLNLGRNPRILRLKSFMQMAVAACLALMVTAAGLWYFRMPHRSGQNEAVAAVKYLEVKTARGQQLDVRLTDGTLVRLNAGSRLRYPEKFAASSRILELEGEAFFTVAKDTHRPFVIHSARTTTRVLGTSFNLKVYPEDTENSIVVAEGKVSFSDRQGKQAVILTANQKGRYAAGKTSSSNVYAARYFAWRQNQLVFDNETLPVIARKMERWFNVKVTIEKPELNTERFSGKFDQPSVAAVMHSLSLAVQCRYTIQHNTISIY